VRHLGGTDSPIKNINILSTYQNSSAKHGEELIKNADIIISQNPKAGHWANYDALKHLFKDQLEYIQLEFWRFNGFWPKTSELSRVNPHFWFPVDEFEKNLSFEDYINYEIETKTINENFEKNIEKLISIDNLSQISMVDFFYENYKKAKVFSDEWHPYPSFFEELVRRVLEKLNFRYVSLNTPPPPMGINNDRHRIVQTSVVEELGLCKKEYHGNLIYFGKKISLEDFYYFSREISCPKGIGGIKTQKQLKDKFYEYLGFNQCISNQ